MSKLKEQLISGLEKKGEKVSDVIIENSINSLHSHISEDELKKSFLVSFLRGKRKYETKSFSLYIAKPTKVIIEELFNIPNLYPKGNKEGDKVK